MEQEVSHQNMSKEPEKARPIFGVFFLWLSAVYAICANLLPCMLLFRVFYVLSTLLLAPAAPVLTVILILQAVRNRRREGYGKACVLSILFSLMLITGGTVLQPYTAKVLTDVVTDLRIRAYQVVVDRIHSGAGGEGIAHSVGGKSGHEDVAFCVEHIRFGSSVFFVYSEDSVIETELVLEYDYRDRTDEQLRENWYRIRIED